MPTTIQSLKLTHEGAMKALEAALRKSVELNVGQNITIVDDGGNLLAFLRMDGAKLLSIKTSQKKALTAASLRRPSGEMKPEMEVKFAMATEGGLTNLVGGFPIVIDGITVGAIGVGSGTGEQDIQVARAALIALGAEPFEKR